MPTDPGFEIRAWDGAGWANRAPGDNRRARRVFDFAGLSGSVWRVL